MKALIFAALLLLGSAQAAEVRVLLWDDPGDPSVVAFRVRWSFSPSVFNNTDMVEVHALGWRHYNPPTVPPGSVMYWNVWSVNDEEVESLDTGPPINAARVREVLP